MSFPDGTTRIIPTDHLNTLKPAYLVRFPEDAWAQLEQTALAGGSVTINLDDVIVRPHLHTRKELMDSI